MLTTSVRSEGVKGEGPLDADGPLQRQREEELTRE
jgi:hypothetical protein